MHKISSYAISTKFNSIFYEYSRYDFRKTNTCICLIVMSCDIFLKTKGSFFFFRFNFGTTKDFDNDRWTVIETSCFIHIFLSREKYQDFINMKLLPFYFFSFLSQ